MKEMEKITSVHITNIEREKAVLEEKFMNSERKREEEVRNK
jgi:hypothetical protein